MEREDTGQPRPPTTAIDLSPGGFARAVLDAVPDGVLLVDGQGMILDANPVMHELAGVVTGALIGTDVEALIPERLRDAHRRHRAGYSADPRARMMGSGLSLSLRRDGGVEVPVEVALRPISIGGRALVVVVVRDLTERLEAERQRAESARAFQTAFLQAPVGMSLNVLADDGRRVILTANEALAEMLGRTPDELIGVDFAAITHPDDNRADDRAAAEMRAGQQLVYRTEKRYRHADGSWVWASLHASLLPGAEPMTLAHMIDIGDRRRLEAERDQHQRWLEGLAEVRLALLRESSPTDVLELVCQRALELVGASQAGILVVDGDEVEITLAIGPGADALVGTRWPIEAPYNRAVLHEGRSVFVADIVEAIDPGMRAAVAHLDLGAMIAAPLAEGDTVLGGLFLSWPRDRPPADRSGIEIVESFAQKAASAMLLAAGRSDRQRLRMLEDRERIAGNLHDLVIQRLFAAGMGLQAVAPLAAEPRISERIDATVTEIDRAIAELRSAIFDLHAGEAHSLAERVHGVVDEAAAKLGFAPQLHLTGELDRLPGSVAEQAVPVLVEALSNVARHARASTVQIAIVVDDELTIVVDDDGVGLAADVERGIGLNSLEQRAARIGGSCRFDPNVYGGTTVRWSAPIAR